MYKRDQIGNKKHLAAIYNKKNVLTLNKAQNWVTYQYMKKCIVIARFIQGSKNVA